MAKKKQPADKKAPTKTKKAPVPVKKVPKKSKKTPATVKKTAAEPKKTTTRLKKTFSVVEFSKMTYLTEKGVNDWLKQGKLNGGQDGKGNWLVDAASLQLPFMKKLIR
jgi:hypothetical protein